MEWDWDWSFVPLSRLSKSKRTVWDVQSKNGKLILRGVRKAVWDSEKRSVDSRKRNNEWTLKEPPSSWNQSTSTLNISFAQNAFKQRDWLWRSKLNIKTYELNWIYGSSVEGGGFKNIDPNAEKEEHAKTQQKGSIIGLEIS